VVLILALISSSPLSLPTLKAIVLTFDSVFLSRTTA
jgi:hypothetical protein